MKKFLFILVACLFLLSCGGDNDDSKSLMQNENIQVIILKQYFQGYKKAIMHLEILSPKPLSGERRLYKAFDSDFGAPIIHSAFIESIEGDTIALTNVTIEEKWIRKN